MDTPHRQPADKFVQQGKPAAGNPYLNIVPLSLSMPAINGHAIEGGAGKDQGPIGIPPIGVAADECVQQGKSGCQSSLP